MRRLAAASLLLLLGLQPAVAQPRTPACTAPAGPLQASICGDAALRAADARLRAAERAAAASTARPATLSTRAEAWQRRLEAGETNATPPRPFTRDELLDEYRERTAQLDDLVRQDRSIRRLEVQRCPDGRRDCPPNPVFARPAALERSCLGTALRNCRVGAAGLVASEDRNTRILWQIQHGFTDSDGLRAGIVLMAEARGGWRLVGWSFEGVTFNPPHLVESDAGLLVHAEGRTGGSGNGNADLFYRLTPQGWSELESESWRAALPARLPAGLGAWQGVEYDAESLSARTPLWREQDGNCCPSGGTARIDFRLEGRSLVLAAVSLDSVARAQQPAVETCPAERATYRFAGEGDFTAELRREGPPPGAESDLVLRLRSAASSRDYWFRFTQSQGYGTQYVLPIAAPSASTAEDGHSDLEVENDALGLMAFHGVQADLSILETPPRSGMPAPRHLFLPGIGQALWYGQVPGAPSTPRESLRPGFWTLSACR
ncbi:hypothetical protein G3576_10550 [Roseomonas stagni]|uniref:Uncharacterized protein n=1 Tax=Falsiroseomonas algicola TaxID=2716930 RepID=A0A6M1LKW4_9PROT|nr:hypothetical protein [Falsiroseomonas algicola]NGM20454.1 hypothetical protein [Falsiroseomonas algicola]